MPACSPDWTLQNGRDYISMQLLALLQARLVEPTVLYRCLGQLVCCYSDCALQSILQYPLAETTKNVSRHDSNIIQVTKSPQIESYFSIAYPSAPEMNE